MGRHKYDDNDDDYSTTSFEDSDLSTTSSSRDKKKKKKKKKRHRDYKHKKSKKKSSSSERRSRSKKDKKKRKKKDNKSSTSRHRHRHHYSDYSSDDDGDDNSSSSRRLRKRQKKEDSSSSKQQQQQQQQQLVISQRHHLVLQAIQKLVEQRPVFCTELPILLIRLVGGTTFNLKQMNDPIASTLLNDVFVSLTDFGITYKNDGSSSSDGYWMFQAPGSGNGSSSSRVEDELILLRIIRRLLDDVGLTMEAIEQYEEKEKEEKVQSQQQNQQQEESNNDKRMIEETAIKLLREFQTSDGSDGGDPNLGKQLIELCQTILDGESICIDDLPNKALKNSLDVIFRLCGLEKSEMAMSDDDDDDDDDSNKEESLLMGYGLPEQQLEEDKEGYNNSKNQDVAMKLSIFMKTCRQNPTLTTTTTAANNNNNKNRRVLVGPQRPANFSDEEGPAPLGVRRKGPAMLPQQPPPQGMAEGSGVGSSGREEWMINPGQHDFLSSIKSGHTIKSRGFRNEKAPEEKNEGPIHPKIQREMDDIIQAHKEARGPSLLLQHREKVQQEKKKKMAMNSKEEWKWNRDKDLDAGRRVDKDALKMVLGGAAANLQTKFQGGFNR